MFDLLYQDEIMVGEEDYETSTEYLTGMYDEGNAILYMPVGDWLTDTD